MSGRVSVAVLQPLTPAFPFLKSTPFSQHRELSQQRSRISTNSPKALESLTAGGNPCHIESSVHYAPSFTEKTKEGEGFGAETPFQNV